MWPILFTLRLGSIEIPIHSYGLLIAIGFILGVQLIRKLAKQSKLDPDVLADMCFWFLMAGFVGARVLFVITRWDYFSQYPGDIIKIWQGGVVFFGGLLTDTAIAIWFFYKYKLPGWKTADVLFPGVVVTHLLGRLGCFGAGCCHGRATDMPWGVRLHSDLVEESLRGIPIHPTQLYEAGALAVLLLLLLWVYKYKKFDGQVTLTYFMVYPIIRSIIETYRGDSIRGFIIGDWLSTSQFISILVFAGAAIVAVYRGKQLSKQTV